MIDSQTRLLANTQGLSDDDKITWLYAMMTTFSRYISTTFIMLDKATEIGVDIRKSPLNYIVLGIVTTYHIFIVCS